MRTSAMCVSILTICVAACDVSPFDSEGSDEPGTLEGWFIHSVDGGGGGDCPAFSDAYQAGAAATDPRPWAVGATMTVTPQFDRPCGFFVTCLPMRNVQFELSDPNVLTHGNTTSSVTPGLKVGADAPGTSRVGVSVDGRDFAPDRGADIVAGTAPAVRGDREVSSSL